MQVKGVPIINNLLDKFFLTLLLENFFAIASSQPFGDIVLYRGPF